MSKLEDLYKQKQYELVIKLVGNSTDPSERSLALSSLMILGRLDEALDDIEKYQSIYEKSNPFALMQSHLEILLRKGLYDEARIALKHYNELPYISQEVEEFLRDAPSRILDEEKGGNKRFHLNLDEVFDVLEKEQNESIIASTIFNLKEYNINSYIDSLKIFLKRGDVHPNFRTYALILLIDQKYGQEVPFLLNGKIEHYVPTKLIPPFMSRDYQEVTKAITQNVGGDTTVLETALHLFNCYIIDTYPENIYIDGIEKIATAMIVVAKRYLKQDGGANSLADHIQKIIESTPTLKL